MASERSAGRALQSVHRWVNAHLFESHTLHLQ